MLSIYLVGVGVAVVSDGCSEGSVPVEDSELASCAVFDPVGAGVVGAGVVGAGVVCCCV